jgi:hypothetical protein
LCLQTLHERCPLRRLVLADITATPVLLPAAQAALGLPARAADAPDGTGLAAVLRAAARSALAALQECRHCFRDAANITALLDAILLPALFDCYSEAAHRSAFKFLQCNPAYGQF